MGSVLGRVLGYKGFTPKSLQELTKKYLLNAYHVLKNTSDIMRHKSKNVNLNSQKVLELLRGSKHFKSEIWQLILCVLNFIM